VSWRDLRVGLVGPLPPPAGGMANQTRQLLELLRQEGADVEFVQTNAPAQPAWTGRVRGLRAVVRLIPYVGALWRLASKVDVVHIMANSGWSWHLAAAPAIWIARLRGKRIVVNYRGGEAEAFLRRSHRLVLPTMRSADIVAVPSGYLCDVFARFGLRAEIVPNIVDLARFRPASGGERRDGAVRILVARNLEPIYDIATALRAHAIVRQRVAAELVVAGSGPDLEPLKALAEELGTQGAVTFVGRQDRDAMAELYRGADVALNPSRVDNMPNSILEALASGVPVVSTAVGGIPYVVRDGVTALLVPSGQPEAVAEAILRVLTDEALAARLRAAGHSEAAKYAWPNVRERLLSAYEAALRSDPHSRLPAVRP